MTKCTGTALDFKLRGTAWCSVHIHLTRLLSQTLELPQDMVVSVLYIQYSIPIWNYGLVPSFKLFKAEILRNLSSNCIPPSIHTPSRDCVESLSRVQLFATPWTVALQAPLFMGFLFFQARILEWVAMPSSRGSSQPRDRTRSPALQADSLPAELPGKTYWIDDSIWCTFPELLCRYGNPHQMEGVNYLMTRSTYPRVPGA